MMTTLRSLYGGRRGTTVRTILPLPVAMVLLIPILLQGVARADQVSIDDDTQALLYEINLARWDPSGFAEETGIELDEDIMPRPPLAPNARLADSAAFKANEMATNVYFDHRSAVTGMWPNQLARSLGYPLPGLFVDDANNIESLHAGSPIPREVLASWMRSPSHRTHVFGQGWFFTTHREAGIGRSTSGNYWVVHSAHQSSNDTFVTGVVFRDTNGNDFMDPGEGLGGITITVGSRTTATDRSGGYAIEVTPGRYSVSAHGRGFPGTATAEIRVEEYNVSVDFISGEDTPVVRDYQLCMGREPTILGTSRADVIRGTPGDDVIHGLGGSDIIYGLGGDDIICGGAGRDRIHGGAGDDRLSGQGGNDRLKGGSGNDGCDSGETTRGCRFRNDPS